MKIKNESINIKIGKKQYNFRNLILDEYLKRFINYQLSTEKMSKVYNRIRLPYFFVKFDDPLESLETNSVINISDFDIGNYGLSSPSQSISKNQVIVQYNYELNDEIVAYNGNSTDLSDYYGRKITAIGFNSTLSDSSSNSNLTYSAPMCAVLDTSNYDIYFQEGQDFVVTRKDIITSDAIFYSPFNIISGPVHLAPYGIETNIKSEYNGFGLIYSIGLSYNSFNIEEEFIIGEDLNVTNNETELVIEDIEEILIDKILHPRITLFSGSKIYSTKSNYNYIILKYKIMQRILNSEENYVWTDTGLYYYQAIAINKFGSLNLKIKYERG